MDGTAEAGATPAAAAPLAAPAGDVRQFEMVRPLAFTALRRHVEALDASAAEGVDRESRLRVRMEQVGADARAAREAAEAASLAASEARARAVREEAARAEDVGAVKRASEAAVAADEARLAELADKIRLMELAQTALQDAAPRLEARVGHVEEAQAGAMRSRCSIQ